MRLKSGVGRSRSGGGDIGWGIGRRRRRRGRSGGVKEIRENGRELWLVSRSGGSGGSSGGEYVGEEGRGSVWRGAKGKENSESNKDKSKSIGKS